MTPELVLNELQYGGVTLFGVKVAPYSFMTARALMMRASVSCTSSHADAGFSRYL